MRVGSPFRPEERVQTSPFAFPAQRPVYPNVLEAEVQTTARFLQETAAAYEHKMEQRQRGVRVRESLGPLLREDVLTVNRLADAAAVVASRSDLSLDSLERDNAANDLYLLGRKSQMENHFLCRVKDEVRGQYRELARNLTRAEERNKHLPELVDVSQAQKERLAALRCLNRTPRSQSFTSDRTSFALGKKHRLFSLGSMLNAPSTLPSPDEGKDAVVTKLVELYRNHSLDAIRNRIATLRTELALLNAPEPKSRKRSALEEVYDPVHPQKRAKIEVSAFESTIQNCVEERDYALERLRNWTLFLKNTHLRSYLEETRSVYNDMASMVATKLTNLESFFQLQKQVLSGEPVLKDAEDVSNDAVFALLRADAFLAGLGLGNSAQRKLDQALVLLGAEPVTAAPASKPKKGRGRARRLKNSLDITLKGAQSADDRRAVEFELQHRDILKLVFEGVLPLTSYEQFVVILEIDFSSLADGRDRKSLMLSLALAKYARLLGRPQDAPGRLSSSNDSGLEASGTGRGSSDNEASSGPGRGGRRARKERRAAPNTLRSKKFPGVKGLGSDEIDNDVAMLEQMTTVARGCVVG